MIPSLPRKGDRSTPAFPDSYLQRVYALPRRFATLEDFRRYWHQDLAEMTDEGLAREARCVRRRLDYERDAMAAVWLRQRLAAIAGERTHRVQRSATGPVIQQTRTVNRAFEYRRGQVVER